MKSMPQKLAKYLVTLRSRPGLLPAFNQGIVVEALTVAEAKRLALDKRPRAGKFQHRSRAMWFVPENGVTLLGGVDDDGSKDADS